MVLSLFQMPLLRLQSIALVSAILVSTFSPECHAQTGATSDADFIRANYTKHEYRIPMRDGARLFTTMYAPKDASPAKRYPIVMQRTPFSVAPYGVDAYPRSLGPNTFMMRERYIFVYQDVRGRYMSEGTFVNARPVVDDSITARNRNVVDEATDTYDTIDWLLKNVPGNNGRVGQWGISYPGFYATVGMISRHPALVASSPQAPVTDLFFEDFHHNGALTQGYFYSYPVFGIPRGAPTTENWWLPEFEKMTSLGGENDYAFQLSLGPLANITTRYYARNEFWRDLVAHPSYDAYWQSRAVPPRLRGVKHAVLVVGGWFDAENLYGPLAVYKALRANNPSATTSIVMGPFGHREWAAPNAPHTIHGDLYFGDSLATQFQRDVEAPFFRAMLKGDGHAQLAGALMFDTGRKRWERFAQWPAPTAEGRSYYFHADGSLSTAMPSDTRSYREYVSDPLAPVPSRCGRPTIEDFTLNRYMSDDQRCFALRADVLTFQTEPLSSDVTLGGEITARLRVSTTGSDADFVVKLIDVYPADAPDHPYRPDTSVHMASYQQLVRGEIMRARFRKSFAVPVPMRPGEMTEVDFRLQDVLHTFQKGHRIMVQVQSSWFPAFDRNPQTYVPNIFEARADDFVKATQRVFMQRGAASGLEVRLVPEL